MFGRLGASSLGEQLTATSTAPVPVERFRRNGVAGAAVRGLVIFVLMFIAAALMNFIGFAAGAPLVVVFGAAGIFALTHSFRLMPCGKVAGSFLFAFAAFSAIGYLGNQLETAKAGAELNAVRDYLHERKPADAAGLALTIKNFDIDDYLDWYKTERDVEDYAEELSRVSPERWKREFPEEAEREAAAKKLAADRERQATERAVLEELDRDCKGSAPMAYVMSQKFVRRALKAPLTAEFPYSTAEGVASVPAGACRDIGSSRMSMRRTASGR